MPEQEVVKAIKAMKERESENKKKLYFYGKTRHLSAPEEIDLIDKTIEDGCDIEDLKRLLRHVQYLAYKKHRWTEYHLEFVQQIQCIKEFIDDE